MTNSELCIPSAALASSATPPAQGQTVEIPNVKGTVTRVDGDQVYVRPTEANGQPLDQAEPKPEQDPTAEQLLARAAEVDNDGEY